MDTATRVEILDVGVCILQCPNTLGKNMNLNSLHPAVGKWQDRL